MVEIYFRSILVVEDLEFIRGDTHSVNEVSLRNLPVFKEINTIRVLPGLTTIWLSNEVAFLCTGTGQFNSETLSKSETALFYRNRCIKSPQGLRPYGSKGTLSTMRSSMPEIRLYRGANFVFVSLDKLLPLAVFITNCNHMVVYTLFRRMPHFWGLISFHGYYSTYFRYWVIVVTITMSPITMLTDFIFHNLSST